MKTQAKGSIVHGRETHVCQCGIAGSQACEVHPLVRPLESLEVLWPRDGNVLTAAMERNFGGSGIWEIFMLPSGSQVLSVYAHGGDPSRQREVYQ